MHEQKGSVTTRRSIRRWSVSRSAATRRRRALPALLSRTETNKLPPFPGPKSPLSSRKMRSTITSWAAILNAINSAPGGDQVGVSHVLRTVTPARGSDVDSAAALSERGERAPWSDFGIVADRRPSEADEFYSPDPASVVSKTPTPAWSSSRPCSMDSTEQAVLQTSTFPLVAEGGLGRTTRPPARASCRPQQDWKPRQQRRRDLDAPTSGVSVVRGLDLAFHNVHLLPDRSRFRQEPAWCC